MKSLRRQIGTGMLAALAAASALVLWWGDAGIGHLTRDYVLSRLAHDADGVIAALKPDDDGGWRIESSYLRPIFERVYSGHYFRVTGDATDLASRSLWDFDAAPGALAPGDTSEGTMPGPGNQRLLYVAQGFRKSGDNLTVWVAENIEPLNAARRRYRVRAAVLLSAVMLVLLLIQQGILIHGFARLEKVRSAVRDLRGGRTSALSTDVPAEIEPLVDEINRLLLRLEGKVARSRNAMADLAHELKRPIHHLRHLGERLDPQVHSNLVAAIDELERLVLRELKRGRIVGVATPGRETRLSEDVPALVAALRHLYPGRSIVTHLPEGLVLPHDRDDILELLGNLLDNGLKHGQGEVSLSVTECADRWLIEVSDQGAGIPEAEIERVRERGVRLDESRAGSGLGLGICADIVREYGGQLDLSNTAGGGLTVRVYFDRNSAGS